MEPKQTAWMTILRFARTIVWIILLVILVSDTVAYIRRATYVESAPQEAAVAASMAVEVMLAYVITRALDMILRLSYESARLAAIARERRLEKAARDQVANELREKLAAGGS